MDPHSRGVSLYQPTGCHSILSHFPCTSAAQCVPLCPAPQPSVIQTTFRERLVLWMHTLGVYHCIALTSNENATENDAGRYISAILCSIQDHPMVLLGEATAELTTGAKNLRPHEI